MAVSTYAFKSRTRHVLHLWIRGGCLVSAISLTLLAFGGMISTDWPINLNVFVLGAANGSFAVAAIGGMMMLAGQGRKQRDGLRMGLWGAAQAISFAMGGFLGTVAVDIHWALVEQSSGVLWPRLPRRSSLILYGQPASYLTLINT